MGGFEDRLRADERPPEPRQAFGAELRKRFLAGFPGAEQGGDSRSRPAPPLRKEDVSGDLESLLRQHLSAPPAREGFRRSLRERFTGDPDALRRAPRGRLLRWLPAAAGLAAAVLVLFFFLPRPGAPAWRLVSADATARVQVGERELSPTAADFLAGLVEAPDGFAVADGNLRVAYGDTYRMEVRPGSRVVLDRAGGAGLRLLAGEVFLQTLEDYSGEGLTVETPETLVHVHGTTLGVLAIEEGTCVCVLEGLADVRRLAEEHAHPVQTCCTHFVFRDPSLAPLDKRFPAHGAAPDAAFEEHLAPLRAFHADPWR